MMDTIWSIFFIAVVLFAIGGLISGYRFGKRSKAFLEEQHARLAEITRESESDELLVSPTHTPQEFLPSTMFIQPSGSSFEAISVTEVPDKPAVEPDTPAVEPDKPVVEPDRYKEIELED